MPEIPTKLEIQSILKEKQIPLIIDVRDLRPEALRIIFKKEALYTVLTYSMRRKADLAYASADELVAVSKEYLDRALSVNTKAKNPKVVYIGLDIDKFDKGVLENKDKIPNSEDVYWLIYAGTLGASYDLDTVLYAMKRLSELGYGDIKLRILGQGPYEQKLRSICNQKSICNVEFLGFVEYSVMAAYLALSDIAINAVKFRGSQSIINKVADYLAAGIPMLNSCVKPEMKKLIDENGVGINYDPEDANGLVAAIISLYEDNEKSKKMGIRARRLAEEKFDRKKTYLTLIDTIENVKWSNK
jgi:glycosyltransferase involved in cell wall biosynthesis